MFILFLLTVAVLMIYGGLIHFYEAAWKAIPTYEEHVAPKPEINRKKITVIIPARNEERNILQCLNALQAQTYPATLTEIIVVNDYSTDKTEDIVRRFPAGNVRLINLRAVLGDQIINSYKKKAIETAIEAASGELIITTDADCIAPAAWLEAIVSFQHETQAAFIAAPVRIVYNKTFLGLFQCLDFLTLQGITGAAVSRRIHSMCNGANLAYLRNVFFEVGGFKGIDNIASGDDMLLMHKIVQRYPLHYFFLKSASAMMDTEAAATWKDFFNQRIRWASKAGKYNDGRITMVLGLVYGLNLLLLFFLVMSFASLLYLFYFIFLVVAKTFIEFGFVRTVAEFFRQDKLVRYFFFLQPFHILYMVIAGFLGKFGRYEWKRRKVT